MTRFAFWQETYLTSLRRLNAYRHGNEEQLSKHAARIADQSVVRFDEASETLALDGELDFITDDENDDGDEEGEEREMPRSISPSNVVPAQRG